jgi:phosphoribosylamine---glycine ligase
MSAPRVLVVGQGGREHALLDALHRSPERPTLWAAPGNAGMEALAERVPIPPTDGAALTAWAKERKIDLAVIGPDAALAAGVADSMRGAGIAVLGPGREAARLEWSKRFAKDLLFRLRLPTAAFRVAESAEEAERLIDGAPYPLVLKADGLAAGKGVVIARDAGEARATVDAWMRRGELGDAAKSIIVEECLEGEEASVLVLTDGERWLLFPPARDHKRIGDGDVGPNTGGMGASSPARVPSAAEAERIARGVVDPVLRSLREAGTPFRGVLYLGLMLTASGPMVLEINARFGDPEAQAVLPILGEDAYPLFVAAARGALPAERHGSFVSHQGAAVCVVLAARGYPGRPETGAAIEGLDGPWENGLRLYCGGVDRQGGRWVVSGGRVVGVTARSETVERARTLAYEAVRRIRFAGMQYRKDIALAPLSSGALADER